MKKNLFLLILIISKSTICTTLNSDLNLATETLGDKQTFNSINSTELDNKIDSKLPIKDFAKSAFFLTCCGLLVTQFYLHGIHLFQNNKHKCLGEEIGCFIGYLFFECCLLYGTYKIGKCNAESLYRILNYFKTSSRAPDQELTKFQKVKEFASGLFKTTLTLTSLKAGYDLSCISYDAFNETTNDKNVKVRAIASAATTSFVAFAGYQLAKSSYKSFKKVFL